MNTFFKRIFTVIILVLSLAGKNFAQVSKKQVQIFLNDSVIKTGLVGISIYEPAKNKYWLNYNEEKNFVPCSNMKLLSLYVGLKYLEDSIVTANIYQTKDSLFFQTMGDPTFLHKDFKNQPLFNLLKNTNAKISYVPFWKDSFAKWGAGWAWNDFADYYMIERSRFSIYGNIVNFEIANNALTANPPQLLNSSFFENVGINTIKDKRFFIARDLAKNKFSITSSTDKFTDQEVPFITDETGIFNTLQIGLLKDTLKKLNDSITYSLQADKPWKKMYSQPIDSMLKPMMFRSDNFFAEQTLLMASHAKLGYMSDAAIIDTLLKTDFTDFPTKPNWVDGSGLSRYNLFSPKDFIYILEKLRTDFGMDRMKRIFTTGGQGTLTNYYEKAKGSIYAKTGSMSGHVALSGFLYTKKQKLLAFSVFINNFIGSGRAARRAIEKLLQDIYTNN
jgi:serine-type D-Ala-D-Ala carboxypeptidase/endopeptidase (penicillin-binding protein 4)